MKKWLKIIIFYWLPVLFVAAMIFTASSQSYEQQDIRPYISYATDLDKMKDMYEQIKMEHVQHRLYVEENGFRNTLQVIAEKWQVLAFLVATLLLVSVIAGASLLILRIRKKGIKRVGKELGVMTMLVLFSGFLVMFGILSAFRVEDFLFFIKEQLLQGRAQGWLQDLRFTYAGNEISVERLGPERFIEFLMRKAAHFGFFFALGFLTFRALWASGCKKRIGYVVSLIFVLLYAISDEIHQAFTPNRTPLVEDVILDFAGGLTGVTLALLIYWILTVKKSKKPKQEQPTHTTRLERRRHSS
ncbi:hypothetical protein JCM9140_4450 [Halalkalibacter wakoensis JCM 9140]|uniref:VanZ-like domain-containing protein n=1 Tax=Halalkalibacter wakoensis JCM 9140 TaxID=1236970 RepID=W4Q979_9BACI|nr:VanZ family protein [Halalkalibacter wakoensis]GAE28238.1 hypothetical protein JCM9140_4450 [Halalkalibacter wakoensis JCM 9140]